MFAEERKSAIVEFVNQHRKATVAELCDAFTVSGATIRNDLRELEENRLLTRTHGGAIVRTRSGEELPESAKEIKNPEEKQRIARAAAEMIDDGDIIVLDSGSTVFELARLLGSRRRLTVVTNDLRIAAEMERGTDANIVVIGGHIRRGFHCTVGVTGKHMLEGMSVDKAFMGANGFSLAKGATTPDLHHAETKRLMVGIALKVILLVDNSKIERNSFAQFASPEQIDFLITDRLDPEYRTSVEDLEIDVVIALE